MKCWERFIDFGVLGEGTYGTVHKAQEKWTKKMAAIKLVNCDEEQDVAIALSLLDEYKIMKKLSHPNIIKFSAVWMSAANPFDSYIVYELMDKDLRKLFAILTEERKELLPNEIKSLAYQILLGLAYCHDKKIIHRDIKPENLLLDNKGTIKIADFGCATTFEDPPTPHTTDIVPLPYRCPEILMKCELYGPEIDMWSFGCVFSELFTRDMLFQLYCSCKDEPQERCQLSLIFSILSTPTKEVWGDIDKCPGYSETFSVWTDNLLAGYTDFKLDAEAFDLLTACLTYDPTKRISAHDACKHPFFMDLDKSKFLQVDLEDGSDAAEASSSPE